MAKKVNTSQNGNLVGKQDRSKRFPNYKSSQGAQVGTLCRQNERNFA